MSDTSDMAHMRELRRAALAAWDEGCEAFGPAFGQWGPLSSEAIIAFGTAYHLDAESAVASLREEHERNCPRSHKFTDASPQPDDLERALNALRGDDTPKE